MFVKKYYHHGIFLVVLLMSFIFYVPKSHSTTVDCCQWTGEFNCDSWVGWDQMNCPEETENEAVCLLRYQDCTAEVECLKDVEEEECIPSTKPRANCSEPTAIERLVGCGTDRNITTSFRHW
jgi:hypothetical protein